MGRSVLLCDDEIHILRAAEFKMKRAGHDVRIAGNGEEAWSMIEQRPPDIVVTDCQMPRLDGLGLIRRMRQYEPTKNLPVYMLTAKGFELSHEELKNELNILDIITKPFSPRELLARVEQALDEPEAVNQA